MDKLASRNFIHKATNKSENTNATYDERVLHFLLYAPLYEYISPAWVSLFIAVYSEKVFLRTFITKCLLRNF